MNLIDLYYSRFSQLQSYQFFKAPDEINVNNITEKLFKNRFLNKNIPCLIKGAVKDWNAVNMWRDCNYLKLALGNQSRVNVLRTPEIENRDFSKERFEKIKIYDSRAKIVEEMNIRHCVDEMSIESSELMSLYSIPLNNSSILLPLAKDIDAMEFIDREPANSLYPKYAIFVYRSTVTDWHIHPFADALLCQVVEPKEILLLSPSRKNWDVMNDVLSQELITLNLNDNFFKKFEKLELYKATIEPGDAFYIPINWWHMVAAKTKRMGITFTHWFDPVESRMFDPKSPASRKHFFSLLKNKNSPRLKALQYVLNGYLNFVNDLFHI